MKEVAKDSQPASATSNSDGAQWHTVKPRKHLVRLGTKPSERIRVVKPRSTVSLFVSRIDPDVTVDEMNSQIEEPFENVSNIIKLNSKFDSYASFKVTLSFEGLSFMQALDSAMEEVKWPTGVLIRRFYEPKSRN